MLDEIIVYLAKKKESPGGSLKYKSFTQVFGGYIAFGFVLAGDGMGETRTFVGNEEIEEERKKRENESL